MVVEIGAVYVYSLNPIEKGLRGLDETERLFRGRSLEKMHFMKEVNSCSVTLNIHQIISTAILTNNLKSTRKVTVTYMSAGILHNKSVLILK